jgi:protein-tyrosine-phosphatase
VAHLAAIVGSRATPTRAPRTLRGHAPLLRALTDEARLETAVSRVPGLRRDDWPLPDPKGKPIDEVRAIRDELARRIEELIAREGIGRG